MKPQPGGLSHALWVYTKHQELYGQDSDGKRRAEASNQDCFLASE